MPSVTTLLSGTSVNVSSCVANWSWCDVVAGRACGWVYTRYLSRRIWFARKATWQRRWDQLRPAAPWREPAAARS